MLQLRGLTKRFGAFEALRSVDLNVHPGEIHGLVGLNGSGKSTLLNILFASPVIAATGGYAGEVMLGGRPADLRSPSRAIAQGIGMIHQEFALIPSMSVAENIMIRRERLKGATRIFGNSLALIDRAANRREAARVLGHLGIGLDPAIKVMNLSVNMQQFVEIAREIDRSDLKVLLLDEPTAALHHKDTGMLFKALRSLSEKGVAIIFVSHRLEEVMALSHRITVLRDGSITGSFDGPGYDIDALSQSMIGHSVVKAQRHDPPAQGQSVIRLEGFSVDMPGESLKNIDLDIRKGEILGLAGLSGQGRPAVGYGIMGVFPSGGSVYVRGRRVHDPNPASMISRGVFLLPEDRRNLGLLPDHSVMDNILFAAQQSRNAFLHAFPLPSLRLVNSISARNFAEECVERFGIRCRNVNQKVRELSGGNQQKVCIARALAVEPDVLLVSEPTRGVDIAAKETILKIFLDLNRDSGTTLIVSSSEIDELMRICGRIAVLYEGEVFSVLDPSCSDHEFALAFSGGLAAGHG